MSIIGIGTDIVHIPRIDKVLERNEEGFIKRILHTNERVKYRKSSHPLAFVAKRFAAKEAVAKALGTGIGQHANFIDIETSHDTLGKPHIILHGDAKETAERLGVDDVLISLSDEKEYAVAYVIMTGIK